MIAQECASIQKSGGIVGSTPQSGHLCICNATSGKGHCRTVSTSPDNPLRSERPWPSWGKKPAHYSVLLQAL